MEPHRRRHAARDLLRPQRVRDSLALAKQPSFRNSTLAGLQAGATVAVALPLIWLSPWAHLIGFASLGALAALFGRFAPERRRNRIVLLSGSWLTLMVFVMSLVAWSGASTTVQLATLALACGVLLFVCLTARLGPPGALIFVFAAAASMSGGLTFAQVLERTAATAAIALLAWVVCATSEALRHTPTPERALPAEPFLPIRHRLTMAGRAVVGAVVAVFAATPSGPITRPGRRWGRWWSSRARTCIST